jgi:hypothetical protein
MPTVRRVLFVDHTARLGGGEVALLNLIAAIDKTRYEPVAMLLVKGRSGTSCGRSALK